MTPQQLLSGATMLGDIPRPFALRARSQLWRPTIKALIASKKRCQKIHRIATYRTVTENPLHRHMNFPGGGIRRHETAVNGLQRELAEELPDGRFTDVQLKQAPILTCRLVPTSRRGYRAKLVVLVAVLVEEHQLSETHLQPNGSELTDLRIHSIVEASARLQQMEHTKDSLVMVYWHGFTGLRQVLQP